MEKLQKYKVRSATLNIEANSPKEAAEVAKGWLLAGGILVLIVTHPETGYTSQVTVEL